MGMAQITIRLISIELVFTSESAVKVARSSRSTDDDLLIRPECAERLQVLPKLRFFFILFRPDKMV